MSNIVSNFNVPEEWARLVEENKQYFVDNYPYESCAAIVGGKFIPIKNESKELDNFKISPQKWVLLGDVEAFVHSHPDFYAVPSKQDMLSQYNMDIPWAIVPVTNTAAGIVTWFDHKPSAHDLVGRVFVHGVYDCYSIVRDWYYQNKGITLPLHPRNWEHWLDGESMYDEGIETFDGFGIFNQVLDESMEIGDVLLYKLGKTPVINHAAVYVGNGCILHHLTTHTPIGNNRLSLIEPMARYNSFLVKWVRYDTQGKAPR